MTWLVLALPQSLLALEPEVRRLASAASLGCFADLAADLARARQLAIDGVFRGLLEAASVGNIRQLSALAAEWTLCAQQTPTQKQTPTETIQTAAAGPPPSHAPSPPASPYPLPASLVLSAGLDLDAAFPGLPAPPGSTELDRDRTATQAVALAAGLSALGCADAALAQWRERSIAEVKRAIWFAVEHLMVRYTGHGAPNELVRRLADVPHAQFASVLVAIAKVGRVRGYPGETGGRPRKAKSKSVP